MDKKTLRTVIVLSLGGGLTLVAAGCATLSPYAAARMKQEASGMPAGEKIHETQVGGYQLTYYLIDLGAAVAPRTNHLMVFVTASDGKEIQDAVVSYKITGPGTEERTVTAQRGKAGTFTYKIGPEQHTAKAVTMAGGYGADVPLREKGDYKIAAKVSVGGTSRSDEFDYSVR